MILEKTSNIEVKKINRNRIYRLLYQLKRLSKQDIAAQLNMSLPTVTQNLKEMTDLGLIEEIGTFDSTGGRKARALSCNSAARYAVGLDITKNNVVIVIINLCGEVITYNRIKMPFINTEDYFVGIGSLVEKTVEDSKIDASRILGVGIAVPAIVSEDKQTVSYASILGFTGGQCSDFSRHIPYPCMLTNDANAGGFAEMWNNSDIKNVIYFSASNSVGGAFLKDNTLFPGENQRCSEIGNMTIVPDGRACYCGKYGCADPYCNTSILSDTSGGSLGAFFEKLRSGNSELEELWRRYLNYLAITINNTRMLFDCKVILGGYLGVYMDEHIDTLRKMIAERNTFENDGSYLQVCRYKFEAAAVGAALMHIEPFIRSI